MIANKTTKVKNTPNCLDEGKMTLPLKDKKN